MRVMVMVKEGSTHEAPEVPLEELYAAMGAFNEELVEAGVMLSGEGLEPSTKATKVVFDGEGALTVLDGPFTESKELVGGFWIWQVSSMEEAVEWLRRSPFKGTDLELRKVMETDEHDMSDELKAQEKELRARTEGA